ncbi:MAG: hypothetical protein IKJ65_05125 [Clostridia bacterium]|nr:hypothetical protein [Clostridia bacterium]
MNEKLAAAKAFLKRVWDKICVFVKLVWSYIVKAFHTVNPKIVSGAKFVWGKASEFFRSIVKDKYKLVLAIILAVAILFSCIAVVRAVKGVVGGIAGIFTSDDEDNKEDDEKNQEDNAKEKPAAGSEEAPADEECVHCENGVCIHCENGFIDCPDCEGGTCLKCEGTGKNQGKFTSLLLSNCTDCRGTGKCDDCNEEFKIDCRYCDGGKCTECAENNAE